MESSNPPSHSLKRDVFCVDLTEDDGEQEFSHHAKRQRTQSSSSSTSPASSSSSSSYSTSSEIPDSKTEEVSEKRAFAYRKKPTKVLMDRVAKLEKDKIFVIQQRPVHNPLVREFVILGTTGNVYNCKIDSIPTCNCRDFSAVSNTCFCKHLLFVLFSVFHLEEGEQLTYQRAYVKNELEEIFSGFRGVSPRIIADPIVTEKYLELTSAERLKKPRKEVPRKPIDGDCPICLDKLNSSDCLVYCKYSCGNNIHKACFDTWQRTQSGSTNGEMKCICCRSRWDSDDAKSVHIKDGYLNLMEWQNRPRLPEFPFNQYFYLLPGLLRLAERFREEHPDTSDDNSDSTNSDDSSSSNNSSDDE